MQGENAALRVKSLELRVKIWCVRLRGHIFIECDVGAWHAPPATVYIIMNITCWFVGAAYMPPVAAVPAMQPNG